MFEEEYAKNQIICWTTCFTVALQKYQVKVSHAKISRIFSPNKNASTEPHNYPLNLFFSLNKDLVCFWHVFFFLMLATIFHKIWHFEKMIQKTAEMSFLFELRILV